MTSIVRADLRMFDQEEPLRQACDEREQRFETVDHQATGHATQHLLGDYAMRMRMIPEQAWPLAALSWNTHLVFELMTGVNMHEDIVAVALR